MNTLEALLEKQKISAARTMNSIVADSSKQLPTRIQLIKAGKWVDSVKGNIEITLDDLNEFKENFDRGYGLPGNGEIGLPVDFKHEDWDKAGAWIKGLTVEGGTLYADPVEWTRSGQESIEGGDFKCISPSFYPACLGQWYDPEDPTITARNVLTGAGLTNIPFFKGLNPVMASTSSGDDKNSRNVIYIKADAKGDTMDLAVVRAKPVTEITDEERAYLVEHKEDLQADELIAFGIDQPADDATPPAPEPVVTVPPVENADDKEAAEIQASIKDGKMVLVEASAYKSLQGKVEAYAKIVEEKDTAEIKASVEKHVARGAIKADQIDEWSKRIKADRSLEAVLGNIPDNKLVADANELGTNDNGNVNASATLHQKALELVKASTSNLTYAQAIKEVAASNADLANERQKQVTNQ